MKLAEIYANYCGVKIGDAHVFPSLFYPTPENYITMHNSSGMDSKNYSYYNEVIELLAPALKEHGLEIIQIGDANDPPLFRALNFNGATTLRQSAHVVNNARLHIGNDSIWAHYAGGCKTPFVSLYGPTLSKVCGPYHADVPHSLLESDRKGERATHHAVDIDWPINIETKFIGQEYTTPLVELVPDHVMPAVSNLRLLNVRMDYFFQEEVLAANASIHPSVAIFTNRPITVDLLKFYHEKTQGIYYILDPENDEAIVDPEWVKELHSLGLKYTLVTYCKDPDMLAKLRLDFFDCKPILNQEKISKKHLEIPDTVGHSSMFKTTRNLVSQGKLFPSKSHWLNGDKPTKNKDEAYQIGGFYLKQDEFWENANHYNIFNYVKQ
jgi:ADP-heptose:LPS heptosyltransferase